MRYKTSAYRHESSIDLVGITSYDLPSPLKGDYSGVHHASIDVLRDDLYCGWVDENRDVRIARKRFNREFEASVNLSGVANTVFSADWTLDSHNYIAVGVSPDGIVHVSGDMHAVPLKYMRTTEPGGLDAWTAPGMIGTEETQATYPQFLRSKGGGFYFFYRSGGSGDGDWYLNKWVESSKTWTRVGRILQGTTDNNSAYPHQIVVDPSSGRWHMFWNIRDDFSSPDYNHDVYYGYSIDDGVTWRKTDGTAYTLPISAATGEKVVTIPGGIVDGMTMLNGGQTALDPSGKPHSVWLVEDGSNIYRYRYVWLDPDGVTWHYDTLMPSTNSSGRMPGLIIFADGTKWMVFQNGAGGRGNTLRYFDIAAQTETIIRDENMRHYLPCIRYSAARNVAYILAPYEYQDGIIGDAQADISAQIAPLIAVRAS
jgi:hypothetical protein